MNKKQAYEEITKELVDSMEEELKGDSIELIKSSDNIENEKPKLSTIKYNELKEVKIETSCLEKMLAAGQITKQVLCDIEYYRANG